MGLTDLSPPGPLPCQGQQDGPGQGRGAGPLRGHRGTEGQPGGQPPWAERRRGRPVGGKMEEIGLDVHGSDRRLDRSPADPLAVQDQEQEPCQDERGHEDVQHPHPGLDEVQVLRGQQQAGHACPQHAPEQPQRQDGDEQDRDGPERGRRHPKPERIADRGLILVEGAVQLAGLRREADGGRHDPPAQRRMDRRGLLDGVVELALPIGKPRIEARIFGVVHLVEHVAVGRGQVVEAEGSAQCGHGGDHHEGSGEPGPPAGSAQGLPFQPRSRHLGLGVLRLGEGEGIGPIERGHPFAG